MLNSNQNQLSADVQGLFKTNSFGPGVFKRIHKYRDSGTYADEALRIFKFFLLPISAFFTLAFGWALHYNLFHAYIGTTLAHITAGLFTAFIEVAKILIGVYAIRLIAFGMYKQGVSACILTFFSLLIGIGAFCWSYYNSTTGIQYATKIASDLIINRKIIDPTTDAAPLSERIETTYNLAKKGINIKWKGKTTRQGQKITENASAAILEQEKQKTILFQRATDEQKRSDLSRDQFVSTTGWLFRFLGGKMEWFQILLIIGLVASEKTLWHRMTNPAKTPPPYRQNGNSQNVQYNQQPIGFNTDASGNVRSSTQIPVNGLPKTQPDTLYHNVPQKKAGPTTIGSDEAIKHYKTLMGREVANLKNENGRPHTVCDRLHAQIIEFSRVVLNAGFDPATKLATEMYLYLEMQVFPTLEATRRKYPYQKEVLNDLYKFIDETEYETRKQEQATA